MNLTSIHTDPLNLDGEVQLYEHDVDVATFLANKLGKWPDGGRIYFTSISEANDVTPQTPEQVAELMLLKGRFYVIVYPIAPAYVLIALTVVSLIAAFALAPKIPNAAERNISSGSPNNSLTGRTNEARPNGRIPDILGTVRSTPDLIAVPYSIYVNNREIENALMCVGRGEHQVSALKDSETLIQSISGSSVKVFNPDVDVSNTANAFLSIGPDFTGPVYSIIRQNSVNGQTLPAYNENAKLWDNLTLFPKFTYGDELAGTIGKTDTGTAFDSVFDIGDVVVIEGLVGTAPDALYRNASMKPYSTTSLALVKNSAFPDSHMPALRTIGFGAVFPDIPSIVDRDLTGVYTVASYTSATVDGEDCWIITLVNPAAINPNWNDIDDPADYVLQGAEISVTSDQTPIYNYTGTYTILDISSQFMVVLGVPSDWPDVMTPPASTPLVDPDGTPYSTFIFWPRLIANIRKESDVPDQLVFGPYTLPNPQGTTVIANFIAQSGLYKDDGRNQFAESVVIRVSVTPVDETDVAIGATTTHDVTLTGSSTNRELVGQTLFIETAPHVGRVNVTAQRISPRDLAFNGQVQDEVKWKDLYHAAPMTGEYGNVTIIRSRTVGTTAALSLKSRKLNLIATRKIFLIGGDLGTLVPTNNVDHILNFVAREEFLGGRPEDEVDTANLLTTAQAVRDYFGTYLAAEFCYTFDKTDLTYEDTVMSIANAVFCVAYRRGAQLRVAFEKATNISTLLFNHRNKLPGSDRRVVRFGRLKDYDGVEYIWVNPLDDSVETLSVNAGTSVNPKKIESVGVRNRPQAEYHAHREWNKIRYQNISIEFESIATAELLLVGDRILVADNTNLKEQDGEIIGHEGFVVETSQDVVLDPEETYSLFLQMYDGTVQSIEVTAVPGYTNRLLLSEPPIFPLVIEDDRFVRTSYVLVSDSDTTQRAFLVTNREPGDANTAKITAINYDARYYQADTPPVLYGLGYNLGVALGGAPS